MTKDDILSCEKVAVFICEKCDFKCSQKWLYDRHITTIKHKKSYNELQKGCEKLQKTMVCDCGKIYKHRQGLWKHQQLCNNEIIESNKPNNQNDTLDFKNLVLEVVQSNNELQKQNQELQKQILDICKNGIIQNNTINTNNSNNKTFNLQVFLNEDCKDAMNISDFMSSIQLQLEELVSVGKLGFVEGISNIIIKNLKALDICKRPLHCTDLKRETVYIKENGVWVKDDEANTKLRKVIKNVAFRNSKNTRLFKDKYPDCVRSESRLSDTYSIIIIEAMGGGSKTDPKESEDKILRRILKELTIDKSKYLS